MISSAESSRGLVRARKLLKELEGLDAVLATEGRCLIVFALIGSITPAIRDRIAQELQELHTLVEESESRNLPTNDLQAKCLAVCQRLRTLIMLNMLDTRGWAVAGVQSLHGAIVVTIRCLLGEFTGEIMLPAGSCDVVEVRDYLKRFPSGPVLH
jgi:hypothetical protein